MGLSEAAPIASFSNRNGRGMIRVYLVHLVHFANWILAILVNLVHLANWILAIFANFTILKTRKCLTETKIFIKISIIFKHLFKKIQS